jgi:hypothetical protein
MEASIILLKNSKRKTHSAKPQLINSKLAGACDWRLGMRLAFCLMVLRYAL